MGTIRPKAAVMGATGQPGPFHRALLRCIERVMGKPVAASSQAVAQSSGGDATS